MLGKLVPAPAGRAPPPASPLPTTWPAEPGTILHRSLRLDKAVQTFRMDRRSLLLAGVATGLCSCSRTSWPDEADEPAIPEEVVAVPAPGLDRGINLSWWLNLSGKLRPSDGELRRLQEAGFGHVRLPVDPDLLGWSAGDAAAPPPHIGRLDEAVRRVLAAGLDLILDIHPGDAVNAQLARTDAAAALASLWDGLAARYADLPADRLVFELVNEPHRFVTSRRELARLNGLALAAVRRSCPAHRVVINGLFDTGLSLRTITPLPDPHLVYGFQFYEPYVVTHQGADWDDDLDELAPLRGVPWPAARLGGRAAAAVRLPWFHPGAVQVMQAYCRKDWDAATLGQVAGRAAAWSADHGVPVLCEEFGVTRRYIDPASRLRWLRDARQALEWRGIPWTVWEYDGVFGVTDGCADEPGDPTCRWLEPYLLAALGLGG